MTKKIAYCFQTYGDIHQGELWKRFFQGHEDRYNLYVHNKDAIRDEFFSSGIIQNKIETRYGSITQLKASINLFEAAWQNPDNGYFLLVSGSCLPLLNFETIYNKITSLDSTLFKILVPLLGRMKYLKDQTVFTKETFKTQATWMVMKRADFPAILKNDMTDSVFGPRVFGVDHHYYINLFGLLGMEFTEYPVTWDNWNEPDIRKNPYHYGPKTYKILDRATIDQALAENSMFIRKISADCEIDPELVRSITGG